MLELDAVAPHYRIDVRREDNLDRLEISVEHHEDFGGDTEDLRDRIEETLDDVLAIHPDVVDVVEPGSIGRTEVGKVQRVYDHRG
jgi:phenylacetate-CoA ligase